MKKVKILVFDTGSGGEAFAKFLAEKYPDYDITPLIDTENSPYGPKSDSEITDLVEKILKPIIGHYDLIVLACNTATAVAIDALREKYPKQIFVGFEPMVKTASEITKTRKIAVLATAATKKSARYKALKNRFKNLEIIEPDCNSWAAKIDQKIFTEKDVELALKGNLKNVDTIILGCTHYVTKKDLIQKVVGDDIRVIEPFPKVAEYIAKILADID